MDNASWNHSDKTGDISICGPEDLTDDDPCFRPLDRYLKSNQEFSTKFQMVYWNAN